MQDPEGSDGSETHALLSSLLSPSRRSLSPSSVDIGIPPDLLDDLHGALLVWANGMVSSARRFPPGGAAQSTDRPCSEDVRID